MVVELFEGGLVGVDVEGGWASFQLGELSPTVGRGV